MKLVFAFVFALLSFVTISVEAYSVANFAGGFVLELSPEPLSIVGGVARYAFNTQISYALKRTDGGDLGSANWYRISLVGRGRYIASFDWISVSATVYSGSFTFTNIQDCQSFGDYPEDPPPICTHIEGSYILQIDSGNQAFLQAFIEVLPVECKADPSTTIVYGSGLITGEKGIEETFTIDAKDSSGARVTCVDETTFTVKAFKAGNPSEGEARREVTVDVDKNPDGTLTCRYTPTQPGKWRIRVLLDGQHVQGSPFLPIIRPKKKNPNKEKNE